MCGMILCSDAGQWEAAIAPSQLFDHEGLKKKNTVYCVAFCVFTSRYAYKILIYVSCFW